MTDRAQAGGQAPSQGNGGQAPQSQAQSQQSLSDQIYGQAPKDDATQTQQAQHAQQGQQWPGMKEGETAEQYVTRINAELARARADAGRYRTELRTKVGDTEPGEDGKTEFQRLQDQLGNLTKDLQAERQARKADKMQAQVVTALASAGAVAPARAARMLEIADADLADDGTVSPEALAQAILTLKSEMPQVFTDTRGNGDGGAGQGGGAGTQDFNAMIRERAGMRRG